MRSNFTMLILCLLCTTFAWSQKQTPLDIALRYVEQQSEEWGLESNDIADMVVSDQYVSKHNGVTHIYFIQRYASFPVYNAINGVHVTSAGKVGFVTNRFIAGIKDKVNTTVATLPAANAVENAAQAVGLPAGLPLRLIEKKSAHEYVFEGGTLSRDNITAKLMYQPMEDGSLNLAWDLSLNVLKSPDSWNMRIDAVDGKLLEKNNYTLYHNARRTNANNPGRTLIEISTFASEEEETPVVIDGSSYNVFAIPTESPNFGEREIVVEPADPDASPFGWHDTDGVEGPEYTITRGNNVHAYPDRNDIFTSSGDEPDGGSALSFDFPMDLTQEPSTFTDASTVQLFYMNNVLHDIAYKYGFDEAAGNFQQNNYGNGGIGGDPIRALAQNKANIDPASTEDQVVNNAFFAITPDGVGGIMGMYEWDRSSSELFRVLSPNTLAGSFDVSTANFGAVIGAEPIDGLVAQAFDASSQPNLVCEEVANPEDINGKIALVDRGECFFEQKVLNAQNAGAIAVIICNFEDGLIGLGGVPEVEDPTIPAVMLTNSNCQTIKTAIAQGTDVEVRFQFVDANTGPERLDGTIDNGIIAHEYAHGISTRLTGGASQVGCLNNDEQMGEGWSDFFSLITTVKPDDTGATPRGIGSYATSSNPNGGGVRRRAYSTDFAVNNQTFRDIVSTGGPNRRVGTPPDDVPDDRPHPVGEVWVSLIWDLYWAMADEHGYDPDIYNGTGGNNMAIQLVMDGMKLQACNPGFLDGRDAILGADMMLYGGANQCLIWEVFARRGFGASAEQGSVGNRNDGKAAFDMSATCIKELKIEKFMTATINPGEEMTVILEVRNDTDEALSNVVVTDEIPNGASFINGTSTGGATVSSTDQLVTLEIGDMPANSVRQLSYRLNSSSDLMSTRNYFEDVETGFGTLFFDVIEGTTVWEITGTDANSGNTSWFVRNDETDNDQTLYLLQPFTVSGSQPALRFFHRFNTETGFDGGIVEISTNGVDWLQPETGDFFRNDVRNVLGYSAFAIPFLDGFTGTQNEWIDTYIDLSDYVGQDIQFRFRFGSDAQVGSNGWYVDDIEIMDVFNYNGEACVTADQGNQACAIAGERGT
ncbi:MAG: M36 family metallopeptidase, partial [Bacteroidota bacterium]